MIKHDLCCIGHITHDKVVTPRSTVHMPGGTSFYVSNALCRLTGIDYALITAIADEDMAAADELRAKGVNITVLPSRHSVYFENIYGNNQDNRKQRVLSKADPFTVAQLSDVEAKIYHLGALLADDFATDVIPFLAAKGLISVDSQGYLREVCDTKVEHVDWQGKEQSLPYIHFLKANEHEMKVLTGYSDVAPAARALFDAGVKEVLITLGSLGSMLYDGKTFFRIPAFKPREIVDATGCGDTYMAGYLYRRALGAGMEEAGRFAAALSTLKIERSGPAQATQEDVLRCMQTSEAIMPDI